METIAVATPFIAMASGVAQAGVGVMQGIQSSNAASVERTQYEEEAAMYRLAGEQEELQKRKKLESVLAMNEAIRAGHGLSLDTGTSRALRDSNIAEAEADIATGRLNTAARVSRSTYGALGAGMRERAGIFSGIGAAVSGLGSAATGALKYSGKA
jgi:hypothetical protein